MKEIYHEYEPLITCPHCGRKEEDSWEVNDDNGEMECGECDKKFSYERIVDVTYTTRKIEETQTE